MNLKIAFAMLALVCAAGTGAAASAGAAALGTGDILSARHVSRPATTVDRSRLWQAGYRHREYSRRRHTRRHRHRRRNHLGFAFGFPFWAFAPTRHYEPPPVYYTLPPAPAWRFDGVRWVCDYVDYYARPLCR